MEKFEIDLEFFDLAKILSEQAENGVNDDYEMVKTKFAEEIWNAKLDSLSELKAKLENTQRELEEKQKQSTKTKNKKKLAAIKKDIQTIQESITAIKAKINLAEEDIKNTNLGLKANGKDVKYSINIRINRDDVFEYYEIIKKIYSLIHEIEDKTVVNIEIYEALREQTTSAPANYTYTIDQFNSLVELYDHMNGYMSVEAREHGEILFTDDVSEAKLSLGDVYFINKRIDSIVDFIKQKQFTPYEAMLYIHNYLTSLEYTDSEGYFTQMITGPLLGQEIVCAGYASLTKAIIDRLDMPGLKCEIQGFNTIKADKSNYGNYTHAVSLIHIKDEKYNIDGSYYDDASSDHVEYDDPFDKGSEESKEYKFLIEDVNEGRFTFFMYPLCDAWLLTDDGRRNYMVEDDAISRYGQIIYIDTKKEKFKRDLEHIEYLEKVLEDLSLIKQVLRDKNKPISLQTLITGMYNVIQADPTIKDEYTGETDADIIYSMIMPSIDKASYSYTYQAQNCLVRACKQYGYYDAVDIDEDLQEINGKVYEMIKNIVSSFENNNTDNSNRSK